LLSSIAIIVLDYRFIGAKIAVSALNSYLFSGQGASLNTPSQGSESMSVSRLRIRYKNSKILEEARRTYNQQKGEHKEYISFPLTFRTCKVISERQECYTNNKVDGPVYREGDGRKRGDSLYGRNRN